MARASLSGILDSASGRLGDMTITRSRSGLVVKSRPTYKRTNSPDQQQAAERMREAGAKWRQLTPDQGAAWSDYASEVQHSNHVNGQVYNPSPYNAFLTLAVKVLQVDPFAEIPSLPPAETFMGDMIAVSMVVDGGEIVFTANGANSPGVVTELLIQRVSNLRSKPGPQYKSMGFFAFEEGSLTYSLPLEPGIYITAYRFVRAATGQVTGSNCTLPMVVGELSAPKCPCCGQSVEDSTQFRPYRKAA